MIQVGLQKEMIQNRYRNGNIKMTYGIRILDKENRVVIVNLPDILCEIQNGNQFHWSILYLYTTGNLGEGKSIPEFEDQILESDRGFFLSWKDLNTLAEKFEQIYDIVILGSMNEDVIKRYNTDEEMYEACDIVIVMFDSSFWEVFAKDKGLIERWAKKFKDVEWLMRND